MIIHNDQVRQQNANVNKHMLAALVRSIWRELQISVVAHEYDGEDVIITA